MTDLNTNTNSEKSTGLIGDEIEGFRQSVTPDLYDLNDFIGWAEIDEQLEMYKDALPVVQALASGSRTSILTISDALNEGQQVYDLMRTLLAVKSVGFQDGRELPERLPNDTRGRAEVSSVLEDLGIWNILTPNADVPSLLRVRLVSQNAARRKVKIRGRFESRVKTLLTSTLSSLNKNLLLDVRQLSPREAPEQARHLDYVLAIDGIPFAAIATVFQTQGGGRQQRELSLTYPLLQKRLDDIPIGLIVIADGRGTKQVPRWALRTLFDQVSNCMTLRQAEAGSLEDAIVVLAKRRGLRQGINIPLNRIINTALASGTEIKISQLPADSDIGRIALAQYVEEHPALGLTLDPDGSRLSWTRAELVQKVRTLLNSRGLATTNEPDVLEVFQSLLNSSLGSNAVIVENNLRGSILSLKDDPVLPSSMVTVGTTDSIDPRVLRGVARMSLRHAPEAKLATLICPTAPPPSILTSVQGVLSATVAVVDYTDILRIAQHSASPRDSFVSIVVERTDLTKVSPFVVRSVTPKRIFYGREVEQATLLGTLGTNSVALLGGRRIGKTSLIRRAQSWLQDADFRPFFGDCQDVGDWTDFGRMARREWNVDVPELFKPHHLFDIVTQLRDVADRPIVLLLDEIDHLLNWDQSHVENGVREVFFRTCRAISQEGKAQFVFSGERVIAQKLWDPHSPHWNFCRPLPLQQLSRQASERLLLEPLQALQVMVTDPSSFRSALWRFSSGHPQIVQFLGDGLVGMLNSRPREGRSLITHEDLTTVVDCYDYAEHYLETYWGQATDLEKLISVLVAEGIGAPPNVTHILHQEGINFAEDQVVTGLRMLELYGIIERSGPGYSLRANWFCEALSYYGGPEQVKDLFREKLV